MAISDASLGSEHPDVAVSLSRVAGLLRETNRLEEAEPLYRRALGILESSERATGHTHPKMQQTLASYERCLAELEPAVGE